MTNREILDKANSLRESGQTSLADKLYDQLLSFEPNNDGFIFYKAMNVIDSNPELAISLFKKSAEINPKESAAFRNITATACQCGNHSLAISSFNDLLEKYPNNLEMIFHRAVNISFSGDKLKSLLDFYFVVDNSIMSSDAEAFLDHRISTEIVFCKTQLRNETKAKSTPSIPNAAKLSSVKMREYQYSLPTKLFGNENFLIEFGKMMGWTINEIIQKQPDYISWCILNLDDFCVSEEVIELVKRKGINMSECEKVNLFKLKIYESQVPKLVIEGDAPDQFAVYKDGNNEILSMENFNRQVSTELYRKWFLLSKKDPSEPYDKEQIDDLFIAHKSQIGFIINQLVEEELHAYRAEIPFLFINDKKNEEFEVEVLVVGNTIDCLSIPGCMVEGENRKIAFDNLLKAVIQCADVRSKNGLWFLNRVFPMKLYVNVQSISSEMLVHKLKNDGWNKEYIGPYHTVLLKEGSKVTYTIANDSEISSGLHFSYNRLQFLMSGKQYREMYQE